MSPKISAVYFVLYLVCSARRRNKTERRETLIEILTIQSKEKEENYTKLVWFNMTSSDILNIYLYYI